MDPLFWLPAGAVSLYSEFMDINRQINITTENSRNLPSPVAPVGQSEMELELEVSRVP